jgi:hypothetical protein
MERPEDCIADFENGTLQAGVNGDYPNVGFYAYTDGEDGTIIPAINHDGAEPAEQMASSDPGSEFVMHVKGDGFTRWGAGVGLFWGGPPNPACEAAGALDCLQIGLDDMDFDLSEAENDPRCDTEEKLDCLKYGKQLKATRDLSDYRGIGFWLMAGDDNAARTLQIHFPIPDTVRFQGECSDDDRDHANDCYNDFIEVVGLPADAANQWTYHEVLLKDSSISPDWGLQTWAGKPFPADLSLGIKFQFTNSNGSPQPFDVYFDDIVLLRGAPGGEDTDIDLSRCDDTPLLCNGLAHPQDCVANFELGTVQAGFDGDYSDIGFCSYNDGTEGAYMVPAIGYDDAEPAAPITTCDSQGNWAMHLQGEGFTTWGAGVDLYWGGGRPTPHARQRVPSTASRSVSTT